MKKKVRLILTLALAVMFAVSSGVIIRQHLHYQQSEEVYQNAAQLAKFQPPSSLAQRFGSASASEEQEEPDPLQALAALDLAALQAINSDVAGWIFIPDTELSYPLLHGTNNDFYLYRSWDKTRNNCGSIFFDYRCSADLEDFHTVIYGHRMRNDSMFGTLKYYKDEAFWREHPTIYIATSSGVRIYDIFAAWEPSITSAVYSMDYDTEEKQQEFLDLCLAGNQLDTGIVPGLGDKVLTLSTCTGQGHATRWVVQAVERIEP